MYMYYNHISFIEILLIFNNIKNKSKIIQKAK